MDTTKNKFTTAHLLQRLTGTDNLIRFAADRQASLDKIAATTGRAG